jgi:hypothetical protein
VFLGAAWTIVLCPSVYLICFKEASDQQLEVTDVQLIAKQGHKVPSCLYAGSSVKSVSGHCGDHSALFKEISSKKLIKRLYFESGTKVMYLYYYANVHELVPVYRQVGVFLQQLEDTDLLPMGLKWLYLSIPSKPHFPSGTQRKPISISPILKTYSSPYKTSRGVMVLHSHMRRAVHRRTRMCKL